MGQNEFYLYFHLGIVKDNDNSYHYQMWSWGAFNYIFL